MQFPESWLREFCNPPLTTQQLADTLTMGGLEVEELRPVAPPFTKIVVGEIKEAVQHPDADRLRVCQVDAGQGALLNIVCGAPNARVGIKVPCALVGAELPPGEDGKPFLIKLGKLRGVESQGMLCSARELKLSEDHGGLLELAADAPVGADVRDVLKLDDTLFTLKLTPNLAHALSVYGVARELSALTGAPLKQPEFAPVQPAHDAKLKVKVAAPDLCGRFSGRIVRNVDTKAKTPQWMVDRLERCGQRSVTALVDISNYVMFEFGRPSHIFDYDKIHGALEVRWGRPGEQLKLLNGNTVDGRRDGRRHRRRPRGRIAGRHHGRRRHRRVRRHAQRLRRGRVLVARRPSRAARAATTSPPMPAIASSAASTPARRSSTSSTSRG